MPEKTNYSINLDIKFSMQELVDGQALIGANKEQWYNQTL